MRDSPNELLMDRSHAELMLRAAQSAGRTLELDAVLNRSAEMLAVAAGVRHCAIYLIDPEQGVLLHRAEISVPAVTQTGDQCPPRLNANRVSCIREALSRKAPVQSAPDLPLDGVDAGHMLAVPIILGVDVLGVALVYNQGTEHAFTDDECALAGQVATAVAPAVKNAQTYEEITRRLAESQSLQRVATAVLQGIALPEILDIVCTEAQRLTGAAGSALLSTEEEQWLRLISRTGMALTEQDRVPLENSLAGLAVQRGVPVLTNDPASQMSRLNNDPIVTALLAVPMRVESAIIGVLVVINKPGGFNSDDVRIISSFADHAAVNMEYARLRRQAERLAVMEERQRLARELHDSVTQSLYSVTLYADASAMALQAGKADVAAKNLHELRDMAQSAMRDMRLLIFELHPPVLEKEGLVAALQARLAAVESRAGLQTDLRVENERCLPVDLEQELYRIAQEALNNVEKHARAHNVTVHIHFDADAVSIEVRDDGVGFDPSAVARQGGMGLRNIAERAARAGGASEVDSHPGGGTCVFVRVKNQVTQ
ncbi:MAG: GAF domain-containing sensor histidine kinase [Chloroflexi bacterium]|nr:GAF domain-containing sensor histidine kinase [Chloroflexota bacterium]MCL5273400.1 GAF domain-containing sensor histidine kinase [Chloroflexota bacterium]